MRTHWFRWAVKGVTQEVHGGYGAWESVLKYGMRCFCLLSNLGMASIGVCALWNMWSPFQRPHMQRGRGHSDLLSVVQWPCLLSVRKSRKVFLSFLVCTCILLVVHSTSCIPVDHSICHFETDGFRQNVSRAWAPMNVARPPFDDYCL